MIARVFVALILFEMFAPIAAAEPTIDCIQFGEVPASGSCPITAASGTTSTPELAFGEVIYVVLKDTPNCTTPYMLRVNGTPSGLVSTTCDEQTKGLIFTISHKPQVPMTASEMRGLVDLWRTVLHDPWQANQMKRAINVSLQQPSTDGVASIGPERRLEFKLLKPTLPRVFGAILATFAAVFSLWWSGRGLLSDRGPKPNATSDSTYSLARVQMLWWFTLIFAMYVFLWCVLGELPAVNGTALALLGMASGTGILSISIDNAKQTPVGPSEGIFKDLTTDDQGVALHRLQLVVWTIFFGIVFVGQVFSDLEFPDFDVTTFALMGFSSATYLGFKVPEKQSGASGTAVATSPPR